MASEGKRYILNGLLVTGEGSVYGFCMWILTSFCFLVVIEMFVFYLLISINVLYTKEGYYFLAIT